MRHPQREAAARCPSCGGFFCRECVVEHDGRVLCSGCLAKETTAREAKRGNWASARKGATVVVAVLVAWLSFYVLGSLLLKMSPDSHAEEFNRAKSSRSR